MFSFAVPINCVLTCMMKNKGFVKKPAENSYTQEFLRELILDERKALKN